MQKLSRAKNWEEVGKEGELDGRDEKDRLPFSKTIHLYIVEVCSAAVKCKWTTVKQNIKKNLQRMLG